MAYSVPNPFYSSPVGWSYRIHRLHLCRGVRTPNECPRYDSKQSDGEALVILELLLSPSQLLRPLAGHCSNEGLNLGLSIYLPTLCF